ncbi:MAG TPA: hypothetical protein VMC85_08885 [Desulfomonilaceae bacterium]|nr:hypothetical protein [Desulfomonilaceae bacterium]
MDDQTILSSEENFGNVAVCPGGVVHVNLTYYSLKFLPEDFIKFSELIDTARRKFELPPSGGNKPRLHLVAAKTSEEEITDEKE